MLKSLLHGFLAMSSSICLLTFTLLPLYVDVWIAASLIFLLIASLIVRNTFFIRHYVQIKSSSFWLSKIKGSIIFLQGIALACWFFDITTTHFALKIPGCVELNVLGWPLGILGAVIYYVPVLIGTFYLLYKINTHFSHIAAAFVTGITLFMASMNFNAALGNFSNVVFFGGLELNLELIEICVVLGAFLALLNFGPVLIKHFQFDLGRIFPLKRYSRQN